MTIGTLIRVTHALDSRVEIKLLRRRARRRGGGEMGRESQKPGAFNPRLRHPARRLQYNKAQRLSSATVLRRKKFGSLR